MSLVKIGKGYVNTDNISYVALEGTPYSIRVKMVNGEYLDFLYNNQKEFEEIQDAITCSGNYGIMACAKKIRNCCQTYRKNPETGYCQGCPFWYKSGDGSGCVLRDDKYNKVDNPGDWDLD